VIKRAGGLLSGAETARGRTPWGKKERVEGFKGLQNEKEKENARGYRTEVNFRHRMAKKDMFLMGVSIYRKSTCSHVTGTVACSTRRNNRQHCGKKYSRKRTPEETLHPAGGRDYRPKSESSTSEVRPKVLAEEKGT